LLRSSYEIYFYEKFIQKFKCDDLLEIDNIYPNSTFRYDFKIHNTYIEIAPTYNSSEASRKKLDKKKKLFGCVLLTSTKEIDEFIDELNYEMYN
jgi:hypothetical protein